jgi:type VII secretion-associated protein (TIGR03931 family)
VPLRALGGVALSAALLLCTAFFARDHPAPPDSLPTTLLVEGRVGVKVPAMWSVQRITSGPGSSRLEVVSPTDGHTALHITQARIPPRQTHESMTAVLRQALDEQPAGVFGDFNPADRWAGRSVVTYRENRPDHEIDWVVLMDDGVRIGIGCQHRGGDAESVRYACDQAVGSAHAVF